jgi:hypothetical protein
MIRFARTDLASVEDARDSLQQAIQLEFSTLPPYLYALYSILPETNEAAVTRIMSVVHEEMTHMCLASNMLNALGGTPHLAQKNLIPTYPGPLPGDIGNWTVHLYPFSRIAMDQAMDIETPEQGAIKFPENVALAADQQYQTIGEFYTQLDSFLAGLSPDVWHEGRNQIVDDQYFLGNLFAVNGYEDAHRAIGVITSQGEGSAKSPLDFQEQLAHYYRFEEISKDQVLTKADNPEGFAWGGNLGVDWMAVFPAIPDPGNYDFSKDSAAAEAQRLCNVAFSTMVVELEQALQGNSASLGKAVRSMFELLLH